MADEAQPARPKLSSLQLFGLMTLLAFAAGGVIGVLGAMGEDGGSPVPDIVVSAFGLGVAIGLLWFCKVYWKRLDEAAREAHKFAWYWGGSLGLLVAGAGLSVLMRLDSLESFVWPGMEATPAGYLATGALAVLTAQVIGYGLVWAGWWLWKGR